MEEQTYCIGLGQSFDTQRRKKEFVNVYFVSKDKSYSYAHKVLLCHLLPFWRDLLSNEKSHSDDTFVILPDYSKEDIEAWLDKVYNIESVVNRTTLSKSWSQVLNKFQIEQIDSRDMGSFRYPRTKMVWSDYSAFKNALKECQI